jgi:gamma-glutamyltranspeptidase / glutathione hydrolase
MQKSTYAIALMSGVLFGPAFAQAPQLQSCESTPPPAFCSAVRGVRTEGWPAQSRSEVMAQHGMVVASQPLAAQA